MDSAFVQPGEVSAGRRHWSWILEPVSSAMRRPASLESTHWTRQSPLSCRLTFWTRATDRAAT